MNRQSCFKALVACVALISGAQPLLAKATVMEATVLDGPLFNITADGEIDVNSQSQTGYGLVTITEKNGITRVKYSWSGEVENASGKAFKSKNPADFGDLFTNLGAVVIDRYEYTVSKSGKAKLRFEAHGPTP
jgi:hypothetical protein